MNDRSRSEDHVGADRGSFSRSDRPGATTPIRAYVPKERVAAVYDGIVAIAATLLVLEIGVKATGEDLTFADIAASLHLILNWIVSFMMIAVLWAEFHFVFAHSRRWDGGLLAMTFAHVAALSLVPFASGVVGEFPDSTAASLVFALVMTLNGLLLTANVMLLRGKPHLHEADDSHAHLTRRIRAQVALYVVVAAISILGAHFHHPIWGILGWMLCPFALAVILRPTARHMELKDAS